MAIFVVAGENFFWLRTIPLVILRVEWFLKRHKRSSVERKVLKEGPKSEDPKTKTLENDEKRKENSRVSAQLVLPQWVSAAE